MYCRERIKEIA